MEKLGNKNVKHVLQHWRKINLKEMSCVLTDCS